MRTNEVEHWRAEFPVLASTVYMISNSLGAMPGRAAESLAEYARTWATRGVRAWEERWWEMAREVGDRIGRIVGAPAGTVSMHENVTTAAMVALGCVQAEADRRFLAGPRSPPRANSRLFKKRGKQIFYL